jgi:hypothetical protein
VHRGHQGFDEGLKIGHRGRAVDQDFPGAEFN